MRPPIVLYLCFFFFFQAEDGIRDYKVTGVQTCALPISFFFGAAMIRKGDYRIMGACAAAICTPPLGLGLATLIRRKLGNEGEREAGLTGLAMGMIGITEGAILFPAADPFRVIPCIVAGSMVASTL